MRKKIIGLFIIATCLMGSAWADDIKKNTSVYKVAPNDVIDVIVSDHPELCVKVVVIGDGTVSLPLIGVLSVEGMTITEIKEKIYYYYNKHYIKKPIVTVILSKSVPNKFYVYGEVKAPGAYDLFRNATVLKAIISVGGFTDFAITDEVNVLRVENGKSRTIKINIEKIIKKGDLESDFKLLPEDIIVVLEKGLW